MNSKTPKTYKGMCCYAGCHKNSAVSVEYYRKIDGAYGQMVVCSDHYTTTINYLTGAGRTVMSHRRVI